MMKIRINNIKTDDIPEWLLQETDDEILLASLLWNRGFEKREEVKSFLDPIEYKQTSPEEFPNMEETAAKIIDLVDRGDKVCVYGDYDVDGITSTAILISFLQSLGSEPIYHLPDRFKEGYGMNKAVIGEMIGEVDLILTCDCGISNYDEIKYAKDNGIDVIVTDHHDLPEKLPPADFILTPKLLPAGHRAKNLPGAGMAYYLIKGILDFLRDNNEERNYPKKKVKSEVFLDLLALAIVADVVPLYDENRFLLKKGLEQLASSDRIGLQKLFEHSGVDPKKLDEEDIAFRLGPIINATGRLESANISLELMLADSEERADEIARKMVKINNRRKEIQQKIIEDAENLLGKEGFKQDNNSNKPIILYQPDWHEGLLGIAAGRLAEEYNRPVLLMGLKEDKKTITGSARSIACLHINNQLKELDDHLLKYGGHAGAAGFSLDRDNYTVFKKKLTSIIKNRLDEVEREEEIVVDDIIELDKLSLDTYYLLQKMAPFGEANPKPRFITKECEIMQSRRFSDGKHLRMTVKQNKKRHNAIWWWGGEKNLGSKIDLIYSIDLNSYRGKEELQLYVKEAIDSDYSYDSYHTKSCLNSLDVVDLRSWEDDSEKKKRFKELTDQVYYYENPKETDFHPIINRYQIHSALNLVLLSIPPSIKIIRELVANNGSERIILAYNQDDYEAGGNFINKLAGIIKSNLKAEKKVLDLKNMAVYTGVDEDTLELGVKLLAAEGFFWIEQYRSYFYLHNEEHPVDKGKKNIYKRNLKELLKEKNSFANFLFKSSAENILKYIKKN